MRIIDVRYPNRPTEVGFLDTVGEAMDVTVSGNHGYVADRGQEPSERRTTWSDRRMLIVDVGGPRFFSEKSCLKLVFAALWRASYRWQGVRMSEVEQHQLKLLRREPGLLEDDPQYMPDLREQHCAAQLTPDSFSRKTRT